MHKRYGLGPYSLRPARGSFYRPFWRDYLSSVISDYALTETHPPPSADGLWIVPGIHVFGFVDLESLVAWWDQAWTHLEALGFDIFEFEVPDTVVQVSQSRSQCIFPVDYLPVRTVRPEEDWDIVLDGEAPASEPRAAGYILDNFC